MALKGNQKKLDRDNNNRIDAQDFKILKAEKAKGRGQGLQDEKMKPGKIMKADKGKLADLPKDPTKTINPADKGMKKRMAERAVRAAKATKIGKIAAGVAGVGLAAKAFLNKKLEEAQAKKKAKGKMGGGMMMRPMGYKSGKSVKVKCKLGRNKPTKLY